MKLPLAILLLGALAACDDSAKNFEYVEPDLQNQDVDRDLDGYWGDEDCDDADPTSTVVSEDGDCDTVLTADDCDDADAGSTIVSEDGDCDTVVTADDCDDDR